MQSLDAAYICDSCSEVEDDEDLSICEQCSSVGERLTERHFLRGLECACHTLPMQFCREYCLERHRNNIQADPRTPRVARYEEERCQANVCNIVLLESVRCRNKEQRIAGEALEQEVEQCTDGVISAGEDRTARVLFPQWALTRNARRNTSALRKVRKQVKLLTADVKAEILAEEG